MVEGRPRVAPAAKPGGLVSVVSSENCTVSLWWRPAEEVGFKSTNPCGLAVFKTAAIGHYATPPLGRNPCSICGDLQGCSFGVVARAVQRRRSRGVANMMPPAPRCPGYMRRRGTLDDSFQVFFSHFSEALVGLPGFLGALLVDVAVGVVLLAVVLTPGRDALVEGVGVMPVAAFG